MLFVFSPAYGQEISIRTDKSSYTLKEYVVATGQISNYNPGEGKTVRIDVFDSEGKAFTGGETEFQDPCCLFPISDRKVTPSDDGFYSYRFVIAGNETASKVGQTTIRASFDGKSVETPFEITSTHVSSTSGQGILSVQTDKVSYTLKEYVEVSGQISNYNPSENKTVRIDVFDPEDKVFTAGDAEHFDPCCLRVISGDVVEPSDDGSYSFRFYMPTNLTSQTGQLYIRTNLTSLFGTYTAQASYDGKSVETPFEITSTHVSSTSGQGILSVQTDKSLYLLTELVRDVLREVRDIPSGYVNVSGQISNYDPAGVKTVRIDVFNPEDKVFTGGQAEHFDPCCLRVISGEEVEPSDDGSYSYRFFIPIRSLMPDRVSEFEQGLYTAQATYDGKSVETTFRISETPGAQGPSPEIKDGSVIMRPLLMASDFPPATMTLGRTSEHLVTLDNYGTSAGQFILMTTFNPILEVSPTIVSFDDIELLHSENNVLIYTASLTPQDHKWLGIPITVPPSAVQFEQGDSEEERLVRVGDQFFPSLTVVLATLRSEDWNGLKENFEGIELVAEALKKSFLEEDEFIRNLKSPVVEKCGDGQDNDFDDIVDEEPCKPQDGLMQEADAEFVARLENTRNAAPALAYYVEIIMQAIDRSSTNEGNGTFVPTSIELPKESYKLSSSRNEYFSLFPEAYAQQDFLTWRIMSIFVCPGIEFALGGIAGIIEGAIPLNLVKFEWNGNSGVFEAGKEMSKIAGPVMDIATGRGMADILVDKIEDEAKSLESGEALFGEIFPEGVVRINVPSVLAAAGDPALADCTALVGAMDPNHLYANPPQYLADDKRIQFTAMFENLANATAPAYDVKVVAFLDENLDLDTFTNVAVSTTDNLANFTLDKEKREATWFFDELTLPPNKNPPEGEGWVKFSVEPKANLDTGTVLNNKARIFFDFNPPIDTNVVEHIVDRDPPSTKMKALNSEMPKDFQLEWEGSDNGSGIRYVTILAQKQDSEFEAIDITSQSRINFTGEEGGKYNFISVARDNAGNVEASPVQADTSTVIKTTTSGQGGGCLIATAAFGSELTPQVQFLRNFRDNQILSTTAGSSFMNVFNAWYYSFSPYVADYERDQPWLQQSIKTAIYPLLGILTLAEKAYATMPGEYGSVAAGLVASSLIGAVYFTPFAFSVKQIRTVKSKGTGYRLVLVALAAATTAAAFIIVVFPHTNPIYLMILTSVLVTTALALTSILTASLVAKVAGKLNIFLSSMFSARNRNHQN